MICSWIFYKTTHVVRLSRRRLTSGVRTIFVIHAIIKVLRLPLLKRETAEGVLHGRRRLLLRRRVRRAFVILDRRRWCWIILCVRG